MPEMAAQAVFGLDREILSAMGGSGGFTTHTIANSVSGQRGRKHSAWVRQRLLRLRDLGLVAYLDSDKPVVWTRTFAGDKEMEGRDA